MRCFRWFVAGRGRAVRSVCAALASLALLVAADAAGAVGNPPLGGGQLNPVTVTTSGANATVAIPCPAPPTGAAGVSCIGGVTFTVRVVRVGHATVVTPAVGPGTTIVGHAGYLVASGATGAIEVRLNRSGRRLLDRSYRLSAAVSFAGAVSAPSQTVTFAYGRDHPQFDWTWSISRTYSRLVAMTIIGIPAGGHVLVVCRGGGCPFTRKVVAAATSSASVGHLLAGRRLKPRTVVWLAVTAPNEVAGVERFTVEAGRLPSVVYQCLPPGAKAPSRCLG